MIQQTPWIERKFNFDFPAGLFPCILVRYAGTPARVEELVGDLHEKILHHKKDGKWSIKEHIGHLTDLDALHERRVNEFIAGKEVLSAADMLNKKTEDSHHNDRSLNELLADFRKTRLVFIMQLEELDEEMISRTALHPRLQTPMRLIDSIYFAAEHDDHHIARMVSLIRS